MRRRKTEISKGFLVAERELLGAREQIAFNNKRISNLERELAEEKQCKEAAYDSIGNLQQEIKEYRKELADERMRRSEAQSIAKDLSIELGEAKDSSRNFAEGLVRAEAELERLRER